MLLSPAGAPSDQSSGTSSPLCDSGLHLNYHPNNTVRELDTVDTNQDGSRAEYICICDLQALLLSLIYVVNWDSLVTYCHLSDKTSQKEKQAVILCDIISLRHESLNLL